MGTLLSVYDAL